MGFLNTLFLAAAATALVPILIHLIQRRRVQQVVFGSLRFLRKTSHRVVRRRRFEEILLVILRALALAALAVAFARPFFHRPTQEPGGGQGALVDQEATLVLVDNSYSMQAEGRLGRAKAEALKVLREADPAARVGVAVFSSQFRELCPIGAAPAQAEEAVQSIQPSWRGTKLALALDQACRVLTRAGRDEAHRRIVLISDFQKSSWERGSAGASPSQEWTLPPGIELAVRNVATKRVPNVFVGRVVVPRLVVAGGFIEAVSATVRNLADKPLNDARVSFRVGGEEHGTLSVNLRPGEETPVRFRYKFTEPGDVAGTISVQADDELPEDNVAHFCVHVTPRVHVLLVNADRAETMARNGGLFIKTALSPAAEGVVSPFDVREIAPEEMRPADLDGTDVLLLLNVSKLPAAITGEAGGGNDEWRMTNDESKPTAKTEKASSHSSFVIRHSSFPASPLGRFVAAGGGIGFICGSKIVPDEFNRAFRGLAPCKLLRLAREGEAPAEPPVVINQTDLQHEIFAEFAQPHSGDFSVAEFTQFFLVSDSLHAQVPARFSDREAHPALLERDFAPKGKTLLFVSSLDLEWNNLCLKSVFVPFVHQIAKRLCARRAGSARNVIVGDEVTCPVPEDARTVTLRHRADGPGSSSATVGLPDRARLDKPAVAQSITWEALVELKAHPVGGGTAVAFSPEKPGIYEVAYKGGSACFAADLDPNEPDLRPLDTQLLLSAVQKGAARDGSPAAATASMLARATVRERIENRQSLWWYLVLAVLAVLGAEMGLATRIGRA